MSTARGVGPPPAWPSVPAAADSARASEADASASAAPRGAPAGRRLPSFATVPRHAVLQRRPPPKRRPPQQGAARGEWDESPHEPGAGEAQALQADRTSTTEGGDPGDARQQGRRRFSADAEYADERHSTDSNRQEGISAQPTPQPHPPARHPALQSPPAARGSARRTAPANSDRLPPRLAGYEMLFGLESQVHRAQGLASLARYAVAVVRQPEAVQKAGWTATALLAFAAKRIVDSAPSGEPAPSFEAIQAALVSASAEVAPSVNPSESSQNLSVLLPLLLWTSQRQRTGRHASEASARLAVLTSVFGQPRR